MNRISNKAKIWTMLSFMDIDERNRMSIDKLMFALIPSVSTSSVRREKLKFKEYFRVHSDQHPLHYCVEELMGILPKIVIEEPAPTGLIETIDEDTYKGYLLELINTSEPDVKILAEMRNFLDKTDSLSKGDHGKEDALQLIRDVLEL